MRVALLVTIAALALLVAGCGDDEDMGATGFVPAAGADTPSGATPGVPEGATYDVTGNEWLDLDDGDRLTAAADYVDDHPEECEAGEGQVAADEKVRDWADVSLGTDFPLNEPVAELLAEGCAAALQSGDGDLEPSG